MNIVYICSPYRGEIGKNVKSTKRYCQFAVRQGVVPLAPHLLFPQFLDDDNERERQLGLSFAITLLDRCDEIWVFSTIGGVSAGMATEIAYAEKYKIPVRYFNTRCKEVKNA
jgi:hypothetical protein